MHRLTSWLYTASPSYKTVKLPTDTLKQIRQLQSQSHHEWVGHFDINRDGELEGFSYSQGMSVPEVSRDYEVSWHTHPTRYGDAYPDWPSRQDMTHVLATVGVMDEVHTHMVFTPRCIYAIGVSASLRQELRQSSRHMEILQDEIAQLYLDVFGRITPENQLSVQGHTARTAWIRQLIAMGFDIDVWSAGEIGAVYEKPVLIDVFPKELSPTRVVLAAAGVVATAVVLYKGVAYVTN